MVWFRRLADLNLPSYTYSVRCCKETSTIVTECQISLFIHAATFLFALYYLYGVSIFFLNICNNFNVHPRIQQPGTQQSIAVSGMLTILFGGAVITIEGCQVVANVIHSQITINFLVCWPAIFRVLIDVLQPTSMEESSDNINGRARSFSVSPVPRKVVPFQCYLIYKVWTPPTTIKKILQECIL